MKLITKDVTFHEALDFHVHFDQGGKIVLEKIRVNERILILYDVIDHFVFFESLDVYSSYVSFCHLTKCHVRLLQAMMKWHARP